MKYNGDIEAQKVANVIFEWEHLHFSVKGKEILSDVSGRAVSGEMLAVMGPSGAGKSTLLDILTQRVQPSGGKICMNGSENVEIRNVGSYVEQNDALLGALTVRETIKFAAQLSLGPSTPKLILEDRVNYTIAGLGLHDVADDRIGNAIQRGISGGQKRRVTIGTSLVTLPKILFLDEPTSGLDSRTGREVMKAIKDIAVRRGIIVIASIHQPNWDTISLFDNLLLLAHGRTLYFGRVGRLAHYLEECLQQPVQEHANPCDVAIEVANTDFIEDSAQRLQHVDGLASKWKEMSDTFDFDNRSSFAGYTPSEETLFHTKHSIQVSRMILKIRSNFFQCKILMLRNLINYGRNLLAYGIRFGMYCCAVGMGVLLATVWVNLAQTSSRIAICAFLFRGFLRFYVRCGGIPAFLEERQVFIRERSNGLYGPGAYVIANSLCTLPYLFVCVFVFVVICYWSIGLHPGATAFFRFLAIIYLAVYAAESQSALVSALIPVFVAALAVASFLNGFWMCVGGYFIRAVDLPRFWYYWAHFIDYQTYAFDVLVSNDLRGLVFECIQNADSSCECSYPSSLVSQGLCQMRGEDVLAALGIDGINSGLYAGILLMITLIYRLLLYLVLLVKKR